LGWEEFAGEVAFDVEGFSQFGGGLLEEGSFFDGLAEGGFALFLELLEHLHILFDAALDAAFVKSEEIQIPGIGGPGDGLGEGGADFGMFGDEFIGAGDADGRGVVIEGGGALETPAVIGDGLDEPGFESAFGSEGLMEATAMLIVGRLIGRREDEDLAGESVAPGIEGARIAGFRFYGS